MNIPALPATVSPDVFRTTLGHFPTGVVLVTGLTDAGPIGMVVGSFVSVSLDPPLVAFLPTRHSERYQQLTKAPSFCINVLADDQGNVCRAFASRGGNDFSHVQWHAQGCAGGPALALAERCSVGVLS